jgi:hypothetical protein
MIIPALIAGHHVSELLKIFKSTPFSQSKQHREVGPFHAQMGNSAAPNSEYWDPVVAIDGQIRPRPLNSMTLSSGHQEAGYRVRVLEIVDNFRPERTLHVPIAFDSRLLVEEKCPHRNDGQGINDSHGIESMTP